METEILVVGGGLAGLSAAAALGGAGFRVEVLERRPILGGRASSWEVPGTEATIDNCQHLLFWCCTNLMDFYKRLGVADKIRWHGAIPLRTPDGRESLIAASLLPAPLHLAPSMFGLHALSLGDKVAIARGLLAMISDLRRRKPEDLDSQTMMSWLETQGQTPRAIERFWRAVLTSALNEDLEIVSAWHGLRVFWKGYAASWRAYRIGLPTVSLTELYSHDLPNVTVRPRASVKAIETANGSVSLVRLANGEERRAPAYVLAAPFEVLGELRPELKVELKHSPITGIHLWFDRPIMERPFTALLGRTIQFAFRRHASDEDGEGYVQCVVSASRSLVPMSKGEIVETAVRELGEFFPAAREALLLKSAVVKELRATYSAAAGAEGVRPTNQSPWDNCWLAGDWTQSGWPATMEGAVRSGYMAAELVAAKLGHPQKFLVADLPADGLARWLNVS
jgi:squalene-associated FAD-dependent desaturase